jgi:hypothetical protein
MRLQKREVDALFLGTSNLVPRLKRPTGIMILSLPPVSCHVHTLNPLLFFVFFKLNCYSIEQQTFPFPRVIKIAVGALCEAWTIY